MSDKLCLITGGSRGLGLALVKSYVQSGWTVREFSRSGQGETHVGADFARRESSVDALDAVMRDMAKRDWAEVVLILNAGQIGPVGPLSASQPRDWWRSLDVNLSLNVSAAGLFQSHFQSPAGRKTLALISSGAAQHGMEGWGLYCLAKAGLERLVESIAAEQEYQSAPIGAISIDPGLMDTDMQADIRKVGKDRFHEVDRFVEYERMGALKPPAAVAGAVQRIIGHAYDSGQRYGVEAFLE